MKRAQLMEDMNMKLEDFRNNRISGNRSRGLERHWPGSGSCFR